MTERELTEKEKRQIEYQRKLKHGQLIVHIKNGEPIRLEDIKQSVML